MMESLRDRLRLAGSKASDAIFGVKALDRTGFLAALTPSGMLAFARQALGMEFGYHLAVLFHARNKPEKIAVIDGARRYRYGDLDREINQLGHALRGLGIATGANVGLMLPNCAEYLIAHQAIARIGATSVQIGRHLKAREIAHVLDNAAPRALIVHRDYCEQVNHALQLARAGKDAAILVCRARPEDPVVGTRYEDAIAGQPGQSAPRGPTKGGGVIIYTSGTTGNPKGANRDMTDTGLIAIADFASQVGMTHDERHLVVCPLYHSAAPAFSAMTLGLGATVVLLDHFDPETVLATIAREAVTSAFLVPTMISRLAGLDEAVRRRYDTSSLRWVVSGAAPLPTETARRFQEAFGYLLWNFYGATETGLVTLAGPRDHEARPGTVGRVLRGNTIRLLDEAGQEVPVGEIGELYTANEMLITGYHRDRESTERSVRDGFFSVGDLGRVDADGYYYIESRKHDMVISGGVNIYPREIENHLQTHPDIVEAAVVGVPDPDWGESLKAFVVRRRGASLTQREVVEYCRQGLADFKRPRQVAFLDALPRTSTGKVLKRELRER